MRTWALKDICYFAKDSDLKRGSNIIAIYYCHNNLSFRVDFRLI